MELIAVLNETILAQVEEENIEAKIADSSEFMGRYGDSQKIINAHMDAIVNLPIVENARDLKVVRHLYDEVEANVRALSALGRKAE